MRSISPPPARAGRWVNKVLTSMLCGFAFVGLVSVYNQRHELRAFKPVDAQVLETGVRARSAGVYAPVVRFQYSVEGALFHSDRPTAADDVGSEAHARQLSSRFKPGDQLTAYYDPMNPQHAYLLREVSVLPTLAAVLPFVVAAGLLRKRPAGFGLCLLAAVGLVIHYFTMRGGY